MRIKNLLISVLFFLIYIFLSSFLRRCLTVFCVLSFNKLIKYCFVVYIVLLSYCVSILWKSYFFDSFCIRDLLKRNVFFLRTLTICLLWRIFFFIICILGRHFIFVMRFLARMFTIAHFKQNYFTAKNCITYILLNILDTIIFAFITRR